MKSSISYLEARELVLAAVKPVETERVPLVRAAGRVLARDLAAGENVPPFDRSPYDGYAFRSADSQSASRESPVTLRILEEIPAGGVSHVPVTEGTAVKVLTGAPIPPGADAVTMFEKTEFTAETVTIFHAARSGENIVRTGEDVQKGAILAKAGTAIDAGLAGTLASQNIPQPEVYRIPRVGLISTGSELVDVGEQLPPGKIYNSNQYTFAAVLDKLGCEVAYTAMAGDCTGAIRDRILEALEICDLLILTGGVSVGDYDLTPAAMELAGAEVLLRGVDLKPGMACAYAVKDGKLLCGLSGNPASSLTNFYAVACPAVRKLCGLAEYLPREITVTLSDGFSKKSPSTRLLRGRLDLSHGTVRMSLPKDQGNVVLSSTIGCDVMAVIPAGSGPVNAGTELKGFLL